MASYDTITLAPTSETELDAYWCELGFQPRPQGDGWIEVTGITRRLAAGLRSIARRGFFREEIVVQQPTSDGWCHFEWSSQSGRWSDRAWSVIGWLRLSSTGVEVLASSVGVTSPRTGELTEWKGGILDHFISERLKWVLAVIGARETEPTDQLTEEEVDSFHDLYPSPVAAWVAPTGGRVVLEDDDWSRAFLCVDGDAEELLAEFRRKALEVCMR